METILFIAHPESTGVLDSPSLEAFQAAKTLAATLNHAPLLVGLVGTNNQPAAEQISGGGAVKILSITGADFATARYASDAAAVSTLAQAAQATIIIAAGTSRFQRVWPGVACRLQGRVDTHVTALSADQGQPVITRWYYRQRMEATQKRAQRPWLILIDPGCLPAFAGSTGTTPLEALPVTLPEACQRTRVIGVQAPTADEQTIRPDADLLFVAGAGWTKKQADGQAHAKDAERLILDFLRHTRASLGSSKSLVDLGGEGQAILSFLTHLNQIGQTGSTPRHPKGLATCCHGEEPHTIGWRFVNDRRAINLDPNCGWARGKADVLYVADAFKVLAQVNQLLASNPK